RRGARRRAAARAVARPPRRGIPGATHQGGRSVPGVHPQFRLRAQGLCGPASRGGPGHRRSRARSRAGTPVRAGARAPSRIRKRSTGSRSRRELMATMSTAELLDVFKNMTVLELNEFLKAFEDEFGVTAAAPVAVAAAPAAGAGDGQAAAEEQ